MSPPQSSSLFGSHGPSNGCVMIVEDEPDVRSEIRTKLQKAGYEVIEVEDGEQAIEAINSGENPLVVDVIITDIPKKKGMEAVTYFREHYPRVSLIGLMGLPNIDLARTQQTTIAILGAGKGGSTLLGLFSHLPGVQIVGITDKDPHAPALQRARELGIPVVDDAVGLIARDDTNLIVDVTGDPDMERLIAGHKKPGVEVLGGAAAKLLWNVVQHESEMQSHLSHSEALAIMVKKGMLVDYLVKPVGGENLLATVAKAMELREIHHL
jgi:CheY-like chemotaxis protein